MLTNMIDGPLADRLEYAILAIIMGRDNGSHQAFWGVWMNSVLKLVPDLSSEADLMAAFKRLWRGRIVRLSKAAEGRYHGFDYSGDDGDGEAFFLTERFNTTITDDGRKYWDGIRVKPRSGTIGF